MHAPNHTEPIPTPERTQWPWKMRDEDLNGGKNDHLIGHQLNDNDDDVTYGDEEAE